MSMQRWRSRLTNKRPLWAIETRTLGNPGDAAPNTPVMHNMTYGDSRRRDLGDFAV